MPNGALRTPPLAIAASLLSQKGKIFQKQNASLLA
jgi:hypothetical protein